jgi:hypothetical protein
MFSAFLLSELQVSLNEYSLQGNAEALLLISATAASPPMLKLYFLDLSLLLRS